MVNTLRSKSARPARSDAFERSAMLKALAEEWDVIVVGAGPAGALAAHQLARRGCKTLLLDKCEFPRPKICGGCLNGDAVAMLHEFSLGHLVSPPHAIATERFQISSDSIELGWNFPAGAAISRAAFDEALVNEARNAGAQFLPGTRAKVGDRIPSSPFREVTLHSISGDAGAARGHVIVVADGLNQTCLRSQERLRSVVSRRSRVGLGATIPADSLPLDPGTVRMTIHDSGYVGIVRIPGDCLTIAAAVDAALLRDRTPAELVVHLLGKQRFSTQFHRALHEVEWRGTGPLTRSCRITAWDDILLVGDASGYIEPFTGEGMAWSLRTAGAAAELIAKSLRTRTDGAPLNVALAGQSFASAALAREWNALHRQLLGAAQRRCRSIAWLLRHRRLTQVAFRLLRTFPSMAESIVRNIVSHKRDSASSVCAARPSITAARFPSASVKTFHSSHRN